MIINPFYMSNSERNYESLVFKFEQLSQNQQVIARYIASVKRQLDNLSERIDNQSELQQRKAAQYKAEKLAARLQELGEAPAFV